jgi:SAM-dependent methyltransferase
VYIVRSWIELQTSPFEESDFVSLFTRLRSSVASSLGNKLVQLSEIKSRDTLLDLGCGPGLVARAILRRRELRCALLVDRSLPMVLAARANLKKIGNKCQIMRLDLERNQGRSQLVTEAPFDHIIAIDLWHLLEHRQIISKFIHDRLLSTNGNLTLALHRDISEKRMKNWHEIRSQVREEISLRMREINNKFEFGTRSRGAVVLHEEVGTYLRELRDSGFYLSRKAEDEDLADINQMVKHLPESFKMEVRRIDPNLPPSVIERIVNSSIRSVLQANKGFVNANIATEVFYVLKKT